MTNPEMFDPDAETGILSILLQNQTKVFELQNVKGYMFSSAPNQLLFATICELAGNNLVTDVNMVNDFLRAKNEDMKVGGRDYLNYLVKLNYDVANLKEYERIVVDAFKARTLVSVASAIPQSVLNTADIDGEIEKLRHTLDALTQSSGGELTSTFESALRDSWKELMDRVKNPGIRGITTGISSIDLITSGLGGGEEWIIAGRPGMGKAQPLYSKVLTPVGWKYMSSINVGDFVTAPDGNGYQVLGTFPQGSRKIYRVHFDDHTTVDCDYEHLWTVKSRKERKYNKYPITITTKEMVETGLILKDGRKNYSIDICDKINFEESELPIPPYILGALLGDGTFRKERVEISSNDPEIIDKISGLLSESDYIRFVGKFGYAICSKNKYHKSQIKRVIEELGLNNLDSEHKFIPYNYLYNSIYNREQLLAGLLDTDGSSGGTNSIEYTSVSKELALNVLDLARSLGAKASISAKDGNYTKNGMKHNAKLVYRLRMSFNGYNPFYLQRKRDKLTTDKKYHSKFIEKVEYIGKEECKCILLNSKEHLYITDNYTITHNSASFCNMALNQGKLGIPSLYFSLEMRRNPLIERMLAIETEIPSTNIKLGALTPEHLDVLSDAIKRIKESPIFIDANYFADINYITSTTRRYKSIYDIKVVYVDYIQLLAERTLNATNELGQISRAFKRLANDLDITIVIGSQLNRGVEARDDKHPLLSDMRQSGNLEEDADVVLGLYRDVMYNHKSDKTLLELLVLKQRSGPTAMVPLNFIEEITKLTDKYDKQSKAKR